ncbi:MAG: NYN domain-containing protein [Waddliaceae bacterium]
MEDQPLQDRRNELLAELQVLAKTKEIAIVFDGALHEHDINRSHLGDLEVHYTASGESADDYIIDYLPHMGNPKLITLVTSDKGLARRAKGLGVHTQSVEKFTQKLAKKKTKRTPPLKSKAPTHQKRESTFDYYLEKFSRDIDSYD